MPFDEIEISIAIPPPISKIIAVETPKMVNKICLFAGDTCSPFFLFNLSL